MSRRAAPETAAPASAGTGVAIECATERVEVLVRGADESERARIVATVGQGHTRRVTALLAAALEAAHLKAEALEWVAADLGPGSFTGVRVGLATAHALALATGARVVGATSLAALALSAPAQKGLIVPLVPAGRKEVYAGFLRARAREFPRLVAAPRVLAPEALIAAIDEARQAVGVDGVRCVGPGVPVFRDALEREFPGSTSEPWREEGLSAADLADAALSTAGPASGLPAAGEELRPSYVRSAQAEERVRHRANAEVPIALRPMESGDVPAIAEIEQAVFSDPWPESFFYGELAQPQVYARVALREGTLAGYSVAWLGAGTPDAGGAGHLGNLATIPRARGRGVAAALLEDLLERARALHVETLTLEVRASNEAAQGLYRGRGFRLAGLRRGYYRDTGEDALVMEWRDERTS